VVTDKEESVSQEGKQYQLDTSKAGENRSQMSVVYYLKEIQTY
jgi:hypothetical protein